MDTIRSSSNPLLKRIRAVVAGREPELMLLEGDRLIDDAQLQGLSFELCLVSDERADRGAELVERGVVVRLVAARLLESVSRLVTSPGVLALVRSPGSRSLDELDPGEENLVVVAAGIADPGNLGALARTAEAAGASALITLAGGARPWSEKAVRGSMGSLLRLPVFELDSMEVARGALSAAGFRQVRASTRGGKTVADFDWSGPVALWLSSETGDLPDGLQDLEPVSIPMAGSVESLNVAAAAAVLLFAAGRTMKR